MKRFRVGVVVYMLLMLTAIAGMIDTSFAWTYWAQVNSALWIAFMLEVTILGVLAVSGVYSYFFGDKA